jgi:phospholipase/carboxylesterase
MNNLQALEICSGASPDTSIIWLHGLGADGYDFAPVVEALQPLPQVRFVLPHAPRQAITINDGYVMPAWYDIHGRNLTDRQDASGIRASQGLIEDLIAREKSRGIAPHRIMLAGFSQGGAIALHTGLRHAEKLAGIIVLSSYLPLHETLEIECSPTTLETPIFMAHGTFDEVIPIAASTASRDFLTARGYRVDWHEYAMPHSVCNEEIADIRKFIVGVLGSPQGSPE